METKFNFKSQVCTDKVQSESLLALGLKPETADMCWQTITLYGQTIAYLSQDVWLSDSIITNNHFPAWSLHRLIEMMPQYLYITRDKEEFYLDINNDGVMYDGVAMKLALVEFVECGNLYDNIICCIAYLIKEGYFNKEYLV